MDKPFPPLTIDPLASFNDAMHLIGVIERNPGDTKENRRHLKNIEKWLTACEAAGFKMLPTEANRIARALAMFDPLPAVASAKMIADLAARIERHVDLGDERAVLEYLSTGKRAEPYRPSQVFAAIEAICERARALRQRQAVAA